MRVYNREPQKYIYIFSILVTFIAEGLLYFCSLYLFRPTNLVDYGIYHILSYLLPIIFCFIVLLFYKIKVGFQKEGLFKGIALGWYLIFCGTILLIVGWINLDKEHLIFPTLFRFISFTVMIFMVAVFEEILCRGIILNGMLQKWRGSKYCVLKSVILSSVIFGLAHLVNLFANPLLIVSTTSQVLYATLTGILFASVYIRCKNIWSVIILHAVFDWLSMVLGVFIPITEQVSRTDVSILSGLSDVLLSIPYLFLGLFYLRNNIFSGRKKA